MNYKNKNYVILDVETTTINSGNPFSNGNKLVYVGLRSKGVSTLYPIEFGDEPYGVSLQQIKKTLAEADVVVGFNIKFDLHWLKHYVPDLVIQSVFDCQLAEFILHNQKLLPNVNTLDLACERRGLSRKLDVVDRDYWSLGIDTPDIPEEILRDYLGQDLSCTEALYLKQLGLIEEQGKTALMELQCEDLLVLQEMEYNGLKFDQAGAKSASATAAARVLEIDQELCKLLSCSNVNFDSNTHVSVLLYGGHIKEDYIETYERTLKDGTVKIKTRWAVRYAPYRAILPLPDKKSEGEKTRDMDDFELSIYNSNVENSGKGTILQRVYSVDEEVLRKARFPRRYTQVRDLLLERREIQKTISTYFDGCNKIIERMRWALDTIHGSFHQVRVVTGRLASSSPNLQNFSKTIKYLFYSRYKD